MQVDSRRMLMLAAGGAALLAAGLAVRQRRALDLRGRVVLITGGSRGLGLVLAREFGAQGARLAICARGEEELERARVDLASKGYEVFAGYGDITDPESVGTLVEAVVRHFGTIDVLVNNAGVIQVGPVDVQTLEDFEVAMRTHFWGPLYTTRAVLPLMKQKREGRIVNISSIGGKIAVPHLLPYSASKFALVGFSEGLRAELAKDGIAVTTVTPGLMRTGSPRNALFKGNHRAEYTWFTLADSLPGTSVPAERAAQQIVAACRRGDAELIVGAWAELAIRFHGLFPGVTADLLGAANHLLPPPQDASTELHRGHESETAATRSWLTGLTRKAELDHNQIAA